VLALLQTGEKSEAATSLESVFTAGCAEIVVESVDQQQASRQGVGLKPTLPDIRGWMERDLMKPS
jgi:hypothetical protein